MERGKKYVQNFVQGKNRISPEEALLQDIEDVVFQGAPARRKKNSKQAKTGQDPEDAGQDGDWELFFQE